MATSGFALVVAPKLCEKYRMWTWPLSPWESAKPSRESFDFTGRPDEPRCHGAHGRGAHPEAVKESPKRPQEVATEGQGRSPGSTPQVAADDLCIQVLKYIPSPLYLLIVIVLVGSIGLRGSRHLRLRRRLARILQAKRRTAWPMKRGK
jgi:hypothetical protein